MLRQLAEFVKIFFTLAVISFTGACKKEHLEPVVPPGSTGPVVYITAELDDDSVYFAGGIDNYSGVPSFSDNLAQRRFSFELKNSQSPSQSYFKISINNYKPVLGNPQDDLDSTIYPGNRSYTAGVLGFSPLAATVYWTDASGIEFKSTIAVPNSFSITSVENVVFESKNYKKAVIEFECYLDNSNNVTIHLTNGKATVLFSVD